MYIQYVPETTKRQATQHGCLPSLLGDGDKGIEIVNGEKKYFVLGRLEQPRQKKISWSNEPPKEGLHSTYSTKAGKVSNLGRLTIRYGNSAERA
jgi:hypothetical protein